VSFVLEDVVSVVLKGVVSIVSKGVVEGVVSWWKMLYLVVEGSDRSRDVV
jgi:uncharacterized membrane protein YjgN (DUF898 family)